MINTRKLNAVQNKNELVFWMVLGPVLLILFFLTGYAILFLTPVFVIYSLASMLLFFRTLNPGYLIKGMLFFFLSVFTLLVFFRGFTVFTLAIGAVSGLMLAWLLIIIFIRDFKWRNNELMELAAMPVEEVSEGYSMRPMPAGKLNYRWEELIGFAGFIRRNLVSVVHYEKDKVIFVMNRDRFKMLTFSRDYLNDTWVAFDRQGNISAHISRQDYRQFTDAYAFDQLCISIGKVFIGFFELYRKGNKNEILSKLDFIRL